MKIGGGVIKKVIGLIIACFLFYFLYGQYQHINVRAKEYGKIEVEKFINIVVNYATLNYSDINDEELILVGRNDEGDIVSVDFNLEKVNDIANQLVYDIETYLNYIINGEFEDLNQDTYSTMIKKVNSNGGIVSRIPLSTLMDVPWLYFIPIRIPIKYEMISNVKSDIVTDIQNYGINHVVAKVDIEIEIQQDVISPFFSEPCTFTYTYPLVVKIINGSVPNYYHLHKG